MNLRPQGKIRVGVIEKAEKLNVQSSNVLLKTLEEPSKDAVFILISADDSLLSTIRSRCQTFKIDCDDLDFEHKLSYDIVINNSLFENFKEIESIINNDEEEVFLNKLIADLRKKMLDNRSIKYANLLEELISSKKILATNINRRLFLENIILKIKKTN